MTDATRDVPGSDDPVILALRQLRLEHGDHPCYDAIERAAIKRMLTIERLRGALKAVSVVAEDGLTV